MNINMNNRNNLNRGQQYMGLPNTQRQVLPIHNNMAFVQSQYQQSAPLPSLEFNLTPDIIIRSPLPRQADVNFRNNPFRKLTKIYVKPSYLENTQKKTLPPNVKCTAKYETLFEFVFNCDDVNTITTNRTAIVDKPGFFDHNVQVQLRMTSKKENPPASGVYDDFLPFGLYVRCNTKTVMLPPAGPCPRPGIEGRRPGRPLNLTPCLKLSPCARNHVVINWGDDPENEDIVFYIELVEVLTSKFLIEQLKIPSGPKMSIDETISRIKKQFRGSNLDDDDMIIAKDDDDDDDAVATTIVRASLHCPLGKIRMRLPAIGKDCTHVQCFDAEIFLQMNEKKTCWQCPVCSKPLYYADMLINEYFENVVNSNELPSECVEVQLLKDGTWKQFVESEANDQLSEKQSNLPDSLSNNVVDEEMPHANDSVVDLTSDCEDEDMSEDTSEPVGTVIDASNIKQSPFKSSE